MFIACLLLLSSTANGQIYKWKDKDGNIHFSDKRPEPLDESSNSATEVKSVYSHERTGQSLSKKAKVRVRALLQQNNFQQLNQLLADYQKQATNKKSTEIDLLNAYAAFELGNLFYQDKFQQWINQNPNSYQAYLARAFFYHGYAWKQRGSKYADKTHVAQFSSMNKYFALAEKDINKSIELYKESILPYCLQISIAKTQKQKLGVKQMLSNALRYNSDSYIARRYYIDSLLPRWGGTYQEVTDFAQQSQKYAYKNKNLSLLLATPLYDTANILSSKSHYSDAEELYTQALMFGKSSRVYFKRGISFYRQHLYENAISDFSQAIANQPDNGDYYYWRGKAFEKLNRLEKALKNSKKANQLEPDDYYFKKQQQTLLTSIAASKEGTTQVGRNSRNAAKIGEIDYYRLAKKLLTKKSWNDAQLLLKKAIALSPGTFEYYLLLDSALFKLDRLDEIVLYWGRYLKLKPTDDRAYLERAGTYFHKGMLDAYLSDLKIAAQLGNSEAKQRYKQLTTDI